MAEQAAQTEQEHRLSGWTVGYITIGCVCYGLTRWGPLPTWAAVVLGLVLAVVLFGVWGGQKSKQRADSDK